MNPDLVGRVIGGRYHVQRQLGVGSFGAVYLAEDAVLRVPRAIKVLAPYLAWHQDQVAVFQREAVNAAAVADHPNIVTIYDFGFDDGYYYIVMQYCEGETALQLLRERGPFAPESVRSILDQIASALDFAHARGRIHRDIKPGNVMVGPDGKATLLDFGLTKALEATQYLSRDDVIKGTTAYVSPEQVRGQPVSPATDTYSLGMTVYHMLTGHTAFQGDQAAQLHQHLHDPPAPMTGVSTAVEAVVRLALEKDPAARWPSAGAFATAFAQAVRDGGAGGPPSAPPRIHGAPATGGPGSDWKKVALAAALLSLALVALLFLIRAVAGEAVPPTPTATATSAPSPTPVPPTATVPTPTEPAPTDAPSATPRSMRRAATAARPASTAVAPVFNLTCGPCDLDDDTTCGAVHWRVEGVKAYFLSVDGGDEKPMAGGSGTRSDVCLPPGDSATFTMRVEWPDGREERRTVEISRED